MSYYAFTYTFGYKIKFMKGVCRLLISSVVATPSDTVSISDIASITDSGKTAGFSFSLTTGQIILLCLIAFILIMVVLEILRSKYALTINRKTVVLKSLPNTFDGTKLVVISDLHQMRFGEYNTDLAKKIKRENPDYIFFVGDMGDSVKFNVDAFYDLLESLGDKTPIIMVPGNHDLRLGGGTVHKNFIREVERAGAVILTNTSAEMVVGGKKLYIYGFCQPLVAEKNTPIERWQLADVTEEDVSSMLGRCPTDAPVILLAHDPRPFHCYKTWGADLILSGHLHGGLMRLPFIGGLFGPDISFMPSYSGGLYTEGKTTMFVTTGLGQSSFPPVPRFLNPPEIAVLTLATPESELLNQSKPSIFTMPKFFSVGDDDDYEEEAAAARRRDSGRKQLGSGKGSKSDAPRGSFREWFRSESRSLRDLLYERFNQVSDFFSLMFGKKRSKYSKVADEKRRRNTYVAPKDKKKKPTNRYRSN